MLCRWRRDHQSCRRRPCLTTGDTGTALAAADRLLGRDDRVRTWESEGLRGGGGNFGIATAFTYRLHPVGPLVPGGPILWPLADAAEVLGRVREVAGQAPDELGLAVFLRLAPPGPPVPQDWYGRPVLGLVPSGPATRPPGSG